MLGWLTRLFGNGHAGGFPPSADEYFPYHDGKRWRKGDPLLILRLLSTDEKLNLELDIKVAGLPTKEALKAFENVISAVRKAFDVKALDEGGLSDKRCKELLIAFLGWVEKKNQTLADSPISAPHTLEPIPENLPEGNLLDLPLTQLESVTSRPQASPLELPSPLEKPLTDSGKPLAEASSRPTT